jgi:uncharacterized protein YndB with AHSA1/START domain
MQAKTAEKTIIINAPVSEVWKAITDVEMVKQYFACKEVQAEWKEENPITFTGIWEGKAYKDRGIILEIKKEDQLHHTLWNNLPQTTGIPENQFRIIYQLEPIGDTTSLTITQIWKTGDEQFIRQWENVLDKLKESLEKTT